MTEAIEDVAFKAAQQGKPSLTTPLSAWVNPFVQRILTNRHSDELYAVKEGELTAAQLLAEMSERNVFDALFNEDMRHVAGDLAKRRGKGTADWAKKGKKVERAWRDYSSTLVSQTQDHQRAAYYLEMRLRRGATPEEAQKAVEKTFYDWRHGVTKKEMDTLTVLGAFYPYTRLAMQQMGSAILEPLSYDFKDTVKYSILGTGKLNRARKSTALLFGLPNWVNWGEGDDVGYAEAVQLADTASRPSFYGSRPVLTSEITPEGQLALRVGPSFGIPETMHIYLALLQGMVGTAAMMQFPGTEDLILGENFTRELYEELIEDQFNPTAKYLSKSVWDHYTGDGGRALVKVPSRYDFLIDQQFPFLGEVTVPGRYGYEMPRIYKEGIESLPVVGNEIPRVVRGLLNLRDPQWDLGTKKGMAWMLSDLAGFTRETKLMTPTEARDMVAGQIRRDAIGELKEGQSRVEGTYEFFEEEP
jgi:hypothetical protein